MTALHDDVRLQEQRDQRKCRPPAQTSTACGHPVNRHRLFEPLGPGSSAAARVAAGGLTSVQRSSGRYPEFPDARAGVSSSAPWLSRSNLAKQGPDVRGASPQTLGSF